MLRDRPVQHVRFARGELGHGRSLLGHDPSTDPHLGLSQGGAFDAVEAEEGERRRSHRRPAHNYVSK